MKFASSNWGGEEGCGWVCGKQDGGSSEEWASRTGQVLSAPAWRLWKDHKPTGQRLHLSLSESLWPELLEPNSSLKGWDCHLYVLSGASRYGHCPRWCLLSLCLETDMWEGPSPLALDLRGTLCTRLCLDRPGPWSLVPS